MSTEEDMIIGRTVRLPKGTLKLVKRCAAATGISMNAFMVTAISSAVMKWRHPRTRELITEDAESRLPELKGWVCEHGSHSVRPLAIHCRHQKNVTHRITWIHPEFPGQQFDDMVGLRVLRRLGRS